jgi:hypothetical protein
VSRAGCNGTRVSRRIEVMAHSMTIGMGDVVTDAGLSDAELIVASWRDPDAFRELYDRWADRLLAYFYVRVLDAEVAADLLAETFAVAYERRRRFRDVGRPGGAWLYGIAGRELSHWFRHQDVHRRAIERLGIEVPALVVLWWLVGRIRGWRGESSCVWI